MPDIADIGGQQFAGPATPAQQKAAVRQLLRRSQKKFFYTGFAVGQPIPEKRNVARKHWVHCRGMVRIRIYGIVNGLTMSRSELQILFRYQIAAPICKNSRKLRNLPPQWI